MGGKSSDTPAPPAYAPPPDTSVNDAMMMQFMTHMLQLQGSTSQIPQLPPTPEIRREPEVNWAEKNKELIAKAKADYGVDQARKKGRTATILTSPLLDSDETSTTSIIT